MLIMLIHLTFPYYKNYLFKSNRGSLGTLLFIKNYKVNPRFVKYFCNVYYIPHYMITTQQDLLLESQATKKIRTRKSVNKDTIPIEKIPLDFDLYNMDAFIHKFPYSATDSFEREWQSSSTRKAFQYFLKDLLSRVNGSQLSKECIKVKPEMLSILSYQKYFTTELFTREFLEIALTKPSLQIIRGKLFYGLSVKFFSLYDRLNLLLFLIRKVERLKLYPRKQIDHLLIKIGIIFNKQRINIKYDFRIRKFFSIDHQNEKIVDTDTGLIHELKEIFFAPMTECSRATKELQQLTSTIMKTLIESKYFDDDALYIEKTFRNKEIPWSGRETDDIYYKIMLTVIGSILFPHIKEMASKYKLPVLSPVIRKKVIWRLKEHFYLLLVIRSSQRSFSSRNEIIPGSYTLSFFGDKLRGNSKYYSQPLLKYSQPLLKGEEFYLRQYLDYVSVSLISAFYMSISY